MEKKREKIKNGGRLRVYALLLTDLVVLYVILAGVLTAYRYLGGEYSLCILLDLWPLPLAVILCNLFCKLYCGNFLYPGAGCAMVEELKRVTLSVIGGYILLFAYLSLSRSSESYTRLGLLISMALSVLALPIIRYGTRSLLIRWGLGKTPVIIAGTGDTARVLTAELEKDRFFGFAVYGYTGEQNDALEEKNPILGPVSETRKIAESLGITYLISTLPLSEVGDQLDDWLKYFRDILVIPVNRVFPILWTHPVDIYGLGAMEIGNRLQRPLLCFGKILCEVFIAFFAILFLSPLLLFLAIVVKCTSRGPVFYKAKRLGIGGKPIEVWKFRTMYADADAKLEKMLAENPAMKKEWDEKFKLEHDPRITPLGNFLRKTSLDELPQFLNVLRGEMAVIGPRPIVQKEVAYYGKYYEVFSRVKPGITGLWQVSGRSETTYERRIMLDMYYINNWSIWLDYFIFLKTIKEVLICRGAK